MDERLKQFWESELVCPECKGRLSIQYPYMQCNVCNKNYQLVSGIPLFVSDVLTEHQLSELSYAKDYSKVIFANELARVEHADLVRRHYSWVESWINKDTVNNLTKLICIGGSFGDELPHVTSEYKFSIDHLSHEYRKSIPETAEFNIKHISALAEKLPFPSGYADIIYSRNALDHLCNPIKALLEINRVLAPHGRFYLSVYYNSTFIDAGETTVVDDDFIENHLKNIFEIEWIEIKPSEAEEVPQPPRYSLPDGRQLGFLYAICKKKKVSSPYSYGDLEEYEKLINKFHSALYHDQNGNKNEAIRSYWAVLNSKPFVKSDEMRIKFARIRYLTLTNQVGLKEYFNAFRFEDFPIFWWNIWKQYSSIDKRDLRDKIKHIRDKIVLKSVNIVRPKVSIICDVYNGEDYIEELIISILNQSFTDFEFVILDDGSTDNTKMIIERYLHDKRIKYFYQNNMGKDLNSFDKLLNVSLDLVNGELICFVGADDIFLEKKLERQVYEFDTDPDLDIVFSDGYHIDEKGTILGSDFYFKESHQLNQMNLLRLLFKNNFIPHPTTMVRLRSIELMGRFETGFCPDYQFWLKSAPYLKFKYINEKLIKYRIHQRSASRGENNKTVAETIKLLYEIRDKFSIYDLYPEIYCCSNKEKALYSAYLDFGNTMLTVNTPLPQLAIREYINALKHNAQGLGALNNLGIALLSVGNYNDSLNIFRKLKNIAYHIEIIKHNADLIMNLNLYSGNKSRNFIILNEPSETTELLIKISELSYSETINNKLKLQTNSKLSQDLVTTKGNAALNHQSIQKQFNILPNVEMAIYFPKQIHFLMNDRCNAKCIMCGGDYFKSTSGKMITLEKFKIMTVNLRLERVQGIVLAGAGDPLLNKDLISIIQFVKKEYPHIKVSITTNGIALSNNVSRQLLENNIASINISINSATRMTYKRIMQVDCFDKICKNTKTLVQMRNLMGKNIQIQFSCAINKLNIEELPLLVELGENIGIDSINIMYCRFYPERIRHVNVDKEENRLNNSDSLFYYQELSDCMVEQAKTIAQKNNIRFSHEPLFKENALPRPCAWPYTETMVGFDGEIYPCGGAEVHFKEKVEQGIYNFGNALTNPIDSFWNNEHYRALRIASKQGETCLIPECRYCANIVVPNDIKFHIMQWDNDNDKRETLPEEKLKVPTISTSNTELPLVSVIVPTYNRPDTLVETLRSIQSQTYQNYEIIVVNDAGMDVENVVSLLNRNGNITYIKHSKNKGLAAARNTGIKTAKGKYIAYLDDDDIFYQDHLETLVKFLETSDHKIAYTDAYRAHQEPENGKYVTKKRDVPYSLDFDYDRILMGNFIPVLCIMHEKSCIEKVGTFDETLRSHEDWDLWMRMSREFQFAHIKNITCEFSWRQDGSTMTVGKKVDMDYTRNVVLQRGIKLCQNKQTNKSVEIDTLNPQAKNSILDKEFLQSSTEFFSKAEDLFYNSAYNEAVDAYKKVIETNPFPNQQSPSGNGSYMFGVYYNLALAYAKINQIDEAISTFKKAAELNNSDASLYNNLGVLHFKKNLYNDAMTCFEKALSLDAHYNEAQQNLKKVSRILGNNSSVTSHQKDTNDSPLASIIIPVFNKVAYTKKCLETLYKNTQGDSFEVIIVDNASTDDTHDFLRQASQQYKDFCYIRNEENLRFAGACNQGARGARGKYLIFLNNDTEPERGWLLEGIKRLTSSSDIGIVGVKLLYPDRTVQHCGIEFVRIINPDYAIWPIHRFRHTREDDPKVNVPEEVHAVTGACLFIDREFFEEVGQFSEDYGMYFEDTDLCFKVRARGKKIFYEPRSVVIHHEGKSSPSQDIINNLNRHAATIFYKRWEKEIMNRIRQPERNTVLRC